MENQEHVQLISNDNITFTTTLDIIKQFGIIRHILEVTPNEHIFYLNVRSKPLKDCIDYCSYLIHESISHPSCYPLLKQFNTRYMCELVTYVNYLDIDTLLIQLCKRIADSMVLMPVNKICKKTDFSKKKIRQLRIDAKLLYFGNVNSRFKYRNTKNNVYNEIQILPLDLIKLIYKYCDLSILLHIAQTNISNFVLLQNIIFENNFVYYDDRIKIFTINKATKLYNIDTLSDDVLNKFIYLTHMTVKKNTTFDMINKFNNLEYINIYEVDKISDLKQIVAKENLCTNIILSDTSHDNIFEILNLI